jgi:hypothetical protein
VTTHRLSFRLPALVVLAGAFACSLAVDTAEIDSGCGPGMKLCEGACVRVSDPTYGCTQGGCGSCKDDDGEDFFPTAVPECSENECVVKTCVYGWGCPEGSETHAPCSVRLLTDELNCGTCGNPCLGDTTCVLGNCVSWGAGGAGGQTTE